MRFSKFVILFLIVIFSIHFIVGETIFYLHGAGGSAKITRDSEGNEEVSFIVNDRLGNQRLLLDAQTNEVKETYKALPYGQQLSDNKEIKYGFTGKEEDDSGLHYFNARYYDADMGKFTSVDPVEDNHAYSYVTNNPFKYTDPSGMDLLSLLPYVPFHKKIIRNIARNSGGNMLTKDQVIDSFSEAFPKNPFKWKPSKFFAFSGDSDGDGNYYTGSQWLRGTVNNQRVDIVSMYLDSKSVNPADYFSVVSKSELESVNNLINSGSIDINKPVYDISEYSMVIEQFFSEDDLDIIRNLKIDEQKTLTQRFGYNSADIYSQAFSSDIDIGGYDRVVGRDKEGFYFVAWDIWDFDKKSADKHSKYHSTANKQFVERVWSFLNEEGTPLQFYSKTYFELPTKDETKSNVKNSKKY